MSGLAHDDQDLLRTRRVRRILHSFVARRTTGEKAGQGRRRASPTSSIEQDHRLWHEVPPTSQTVRADPERVAAILYQPANTPVGHRSLASYGACARTQARSRFTSEALGYRNVVLRAFSSGLPLSPRAGPRVVRLTSCAALRRSGAWCGACCSQR